MRTEVCKEVKMVKMQWRQMVGVVALASVAGFGHSAAAQTASQERVAAIKQSLQESMAALRQYEWVETTVIRVKDEEKSRTQQRSYYGADGEIQKVALTQPAASEQEKSGGRGRGGGRLRKRIVERKTEQITEYMQRAVQTVHSYLPPDPVFVQKSRDAEKVTIQPLDAGRARVVLNDYMRPGDALTLELDLMTNSILAIEVDTYIEDVDDRVSLVVTFGRLEGGVSYQAETILEAPSQNVTVTIQNSDHRRLAP
jgi:hypothetical protein